MKSLQILNESPLDFVHIFPLHFIGKSFVEVFSLKCRGIYIFKKITKYFPLKFKGCYLFLHNSVAFHRKTVWKEGAIGGACFHNQPIRRGRKSLSKMKRLCIVALIIRSRIYCRLIIFKFYLMTPNIAISLSFIIIHCKVIPSR